MWQVHDSVLQTSSYVICLCNIIIVFRPCTDRQGGRNFTVRHGEIFVNRSTCMRCRCNDGNGEDCRRDPLVNCSRLDPGRNPRDCTRRGITVQHGSRRMVRVQSLSRITNLKTQCDVMIKTLAPCYLKETEVPD